MKDFGDLLIRESLDFAKHDHGAIAFRDLPEGVLDSGAELGLYRVIVGASAAVGKQACERWSVLLIGAGGRVDGKLLPLVPTPPATLVRGLVESDTVEPCAQGRIAVERADRAKDLEEDILGDVSGVGRVVNAAGN